MREFKLTICNNFSCNESKYILVMVMEAFSLTLPRLLKGLTNARNIRLKLADFTGKENLLGLGSLGSDGRGSNPCTGQSLSFEFSVKVNYFLKRVVIFIQSSVEQCCKVK